MYKIIFLLFLFLSAQGFSQDTKPELIINEVQNNFDGVQDYQVDVSIKVDVNFLKVPESKAKLYFKQPDKIHFESDGFALLPKEGMNFSPFAFTKGDYTALFEKEEILDGIKTTIIKIIPLGDVNNIILSTLWIDRSKKVIRKVESTTKTNGTFVMELKYDDPKLNFPLPTSMTFVFNIDKLNLPKSISGDMNTETKKEDDNKTTTGKVFIKYSNYKVNKGISDSMFDEKKK